MIDLICYDIEKNKIRNKVAKTIEKAGCIRIQKSVFIGTYRSYKRKQLFIKLQELLAKEESDNNKIYLFSIDENDLQQFKGIGECPPFEYITGKQKTMMIA